MLNSRPVHSGLECTTINTQHLRHLTLLLNLTAELVGWYKISLQGLLRLYEKPLSKINAKNTTYGASMLGSEATEDE